MGRVHGEFGFELAECHIMLYLHGKIIHGLGLATGYLAMQIPLIARRFPEIRDCHFGSINLRLDKPVRIVRPDHTTREIDWGVMKEIFDFTRVTIEPLKKRMGRNRKYRAWIYGPRNSPHRGDAFHLEIIVDQKIDLKGVKRCLVRIEKKGKKYPLTVI
jgi:hypothetical protein